LYIFVDIVVHHLDYLYIVQTRLLALRRLFGAYFGENIVVFIIKITEKFDFVDRIGYFILDNATLNGIGSRQTFSTIAGRARNPPFK
jgi:hypothetical protein